MIHVAKGTKANLCRQDVTQQSWVYCSAPVPDSISPSFSSRNHCGSFLTHLQPSIYTNKSNQPLCKTSDSKLERTPNPNALNPKQLLQKGSQVITAKLPSLCHCNAQSHPYCSEAQQHSGQGELPFSQVFHAFLLITAGSF